MTSRFSRFWERRASRPRRTMVELIGIVVLLVLVGIGIAKLKAELDRPLGPSLPPQPAPPAAEIVPVAIPEAEKPFFAWLQQGKAKPACDGPETLTILAIGVDRREGNTEAYGLTDVIRVTRINFMTSQVSTLAIPRDFWVAIPGLDATQGTGVTTYFGKPIIDGGVLEQPGYYARINSAYFYGNLYDLPGGGPGALAQVLYDTFDIRVERYIEVDMQAFRDTVDALGGIDIEIDNDVGPFTAGLHHMDGAEALRYARLRKTDNDWHRIDRQTQVMMAVRDTALQPDMISSMPQVTDIVLSNIITDLSKSEILSLACMANKVEQNDIVNYVIGSDLVIQTYTTSRAYVMVPRQKAVQELIDSFLYGE